MKKQSGFTLIEGVVSLFMIAVMLVLYSAALNTLTLTRKLRYENVAYHIANKQMETLRNTVFASLPTSGTISDALLSQIPSGAGDFTTSDYGSFSNVKEIVVTVTWNDGLAREVVLQTLAGSGGINP